MKKALLALLIITAAVAMSACGAKTKAPEGMVALDGENVTFTVFVPKTWTAALSGGAVSAYADDMSNVSVQTLAVAKDEGGKRLYADVGEFWENGYKVSLEHTFAKAAYSETSEYTLAGEKGLKAEYTVITFDISAKAEKTYKITQIFAEHGDNFYIITYTAESDKYSAHKNEVDSILANFSFR